MNSPARIFFFHTFFPLIGMIIGGLITSVYKPSERFISGTQHLAAGVIFAAVAIELLPRISPNDTPFALTIGFLLGMVIMLILKTITNKIARSKSNYNMPIGYVSAIGIDLLIDGTLIGIAFLAGKEGGILVALALGIEIFFLGLSSATALKKRRIPTLSIILLTCILALLIPAGSFLGTGVLSYLPASYTTAFIAFGIAALLYLVTEELLTEAHEAAIESPVATSLFFLGFLFIVLMTGITHE